MKNWLVEALQEARKMAQERPDLVRIVKQYPSGFIGDLAEPKIEEAEARTRSEIGGPAGLAGSVSKN